MTHDAARIDHEPSRRYFDTEYREPQASYGSTSEFVRLLEDPRAEDEQEWFIRRQMKRRSQRSQRRILENGEALKYIDVVLRQLWKASRDHRQLIEQRHALADDPRASTRRSTTFKVPYRRELSVDDVSDPFEHDPTRSRSLQSGVLVDERELADFSRLEPTTKLLAKKKYLESGLAALESAQKRHYDRMTMASRSTTYVPAHELISGRDARRRLLDWNLTGFPERTHASTNV